MAFNDFTINDLGSLSPAFSQVITKYNLSERQQLILNSLKNIIFGQMTLPDFVELIQQELSLDFMTAGKVAADLKKNIIDKTAEIDAIKEQWQKESAEISNLNNIIDDVLDEANLAFTDDQLKGRFEKAAFDWLTGLSTDLELKNTLTKSQKIGGIGFSEEVYTSLHELLVAKKEQIQKEQIELPAIDKTPKKKRKITPPPIIGQEIEEAAELNTPVLQKKEGAVNFNAEIKALISEAKIGVKEELRQRLEKLLNTYFLDVRKEADFGEMLLRPAKIGGIGLAEAEADNLINLARSKKKYWQENKIVFKAEEEGNISLGALEQEIDVYGKIKKSVSRKIEGPDVNIDQLLQEKGIEFAELAEKERIKRQLGDKERVPEVPDLAEEIIEEEKFLESKKEISAPLPEPEPLPPPPLPAAPLPPPPPPPVKKIEPIAPKFQAKPPLIRRSDADNRPKMEDIKVEVTAALYGPIEELNALSIMDFRRLSKDPKEAALKIMGKLDLLEDESLVKKMQGIKALRSSPLYKTYAEIMNQAMIAGKSIEQILNENKTISLPEYKAIMDLNQSLKY